jgi:hypothetical protein
VWGVWTGLVLRSDQIIHGWKGGDLACLFVHLYTRVYTPPSLLPTTSAIIFFCPHPQVGRSRTSSSDEGVGRAGSGVWIHPLAEDESREF